MDAAVSVEERFWRRVDKSDACWEWTGVRDEHGYGFFYVSKVRRRRAHRVSYELAHGPIPDGLCVLHRCDNPPCVNPAHLFLGTRQDNNADKMAKGRHRGGRLAGEQHPQAKLTASTVETIRLHLLLAETRQRALAERFGVTESTISLIARGRTWREVA